MKLKKLLKFDYIHDFESLLVTDFERELFTASLRNYCSHGNPLRFHNFAFSMRELVLCIIDRRAPDKLVKTTNWYVRGSGKHEVTRAQKLKFCAQGYLSDKYLSETTLDILDQSIKDYLKEFNFFNKYTHITEKHFTASPKRFYQDMKFIIQRSSEVVDQLHSLERDIGERLIDDIQEKVFQEVINSATPGDLDLLANAVIFESISPEKVLLKAHNDNDLLLDASGTIYVSQEYGKGDDFCSMSTNYPFTIPIKACVNNPENMTVFIDDLEIDTSSWYR